MQSKIKKYFFIVTLIGIILSILFLLWCNRPICFSEDKEKIIIRINSIDEVGQRYNKVNNIILNDCSDYTVDYNQDTILFINKKGDLIEKSIISGEETKLDYLTDISDKLRGETVFNEKDILENFQYGPGDNEISFQYGNDVYTYDTKRNLLNKVTNNVSGLLSYGWSANHILYTINNYNKQGGSGLHIWNEKKHDQLLIAENIVRFEFGVNSEIVYGISERWNYNGFTIEIDYELVEINLTNGKVEKLADINTESNFRIKNINDKYLLFVEHKLYRKRSKVFSYNLKTGKKKCFYETNEEVIGFIID